jgi:hypothetical protein
MSRGYLHVGSIADNRVRVRNQGDLVIQKADSKNIKQKVKITTTDCGRIFDFLSIILHFPF